MSKRSKKSKSPKQEADAISPGYNVWVIAALFGVCLVSLILGYREVFSPDIGFYLEIGKNIVEQGKVPFEEQLTYSANGNPIPYAPWLFCLLSWWLYQVGGTIVFVVLKMILTLLTFALLVWQSIRRLGYLSFWVPVFLLLFALGNLWEYRPHTFSWLFLMGMFTSLELYREDKKRALWLMPCIMFLWVNIHSLYVLGLIVVAFYLLADFIKKTEFDFHLIKWCVVSGLACFLTPYFKEVVLYPLTQFGILSGGLIKSETSGTAEFLSPFSTYLYTWSGRTVWYQPIFFIQLYGILAVLIYLLTFTKRTVLDWLLAGAFGFIFFKAVKNHGYFVLVTFPALVAGCDFLVTKLSEVIKNKQKWIEQILPIGTSLSVLVVCVVMCVHLLNGYYYSQARLPHNLGHQFNESVLPVRACKFIQEDQKEGRILNNWDSGGFVSFATDSPVFIYGWNELMGEDFYREYQLFKKLDRLPILLRKWQQKKALVPFNDIPQWFYFFENSEDWQCVYLDDRDAIFYHQSIVSSTQELVNGIDIEESQLMFTDQEVNMLLENAASKKMPSFWDSLSKIHYEPRRELRLTAASLLRNDPKICIQYGLSALDKSTFPAPEILLNLGHAYFGLKDYGKARLCFEGALKWFEDPEAERRLVQIRGLQ